MSSIEVNMEALEKYAEERARALVNNEVSRRVKELTCYGRIDHMIENAVREHITKEVVEPVVKTMDRAELVKVMSDAIAVRLIAELDSSESYYD